MRCKIPTKARYPGLLRNCIGAFSPYLGPTGVSLQDRSGYNNHGTLTTMDPTSDWVLKSGVWGLDFDGVNDHVQLSFNNLSVANLQSFTISAWVNFTAGGVQTTIYSETSTSSTVPFIQLRINTTNVLACQFRNSANTTLTLSGGPTLNDGLWHHVAVRRDGASGELLVDGIVVSSGPVPTGSYVTNAATIGAFRRTTTTNYFSGVIGEVHVYGIAVPQQTIDLLRLRQGIAYETTNRRSRKAAGSASTGSASFNFTAAAGGAANFTGGGSASFNFTATAGGAADFTGSGASIFSFSAAAGGAADATGSGAANFSFSAAAGGAADATGSGAADFSFTAVGISILPGTGTGSASFSFASAAGGLADAAGTGSASFSFAAAAGGAADSTGSGAASFSIAASAAGMADATGSGAASFRFTAVGTSSGPVNFGTPTCGWSFEPQATVFTFAQPETVWEFGDC